MGRKKLLTDDVIRRFADAIYIGATKEMAAAYAGVSISSIMLWQRLGEEEKARIDAGKKPRKSHELYLQFLQEMEASRAKLGIELLQEIQQARKSGNVEATWRLLSSKYPEFSQRAKINANVDGEVTINIRYVEKGGDGNND